jgi:lysophospholipase L1-like esterase
MRRGGLPGGRAALVGAVVVGLAAAVPLAGSAGATSRATSATTMIYPDNPAIRYTEYAHATISHAGAVFDRPGVANGNAIASPGTRVNFRTDATRVWVVVTYTFACNAPGCGRFSAERDGRLLPQTFGSDTVSGQTTYLLALQTSPLPHNFSLIWPYGTQMVFDGLELQGGQPRLLSPAPIRPAFRYVAYGDSITQGYYASSGIVDTYPDQVGHKKGWSVVNMGFGGETTVPSDGSAVGLLGGNLVTVAIGVNDFGTSKPLAAFVSDYNALLDAVRALQPVVSLYCLTPIWTSLEAVTNAQGLHVQDYRQAIASIVQQRMATDPNLHLVDGLKLVPNQLKYFVDGLHPNDAGFALYAANLAAKLSG